MYYNIQMFTIAAKNLPMLAALKFRENIISIVAVTTSITVLNQLRQLSLPLVFIAFNHVKNW